MPGRLIGIIIGIGLLVAFIALNLHNVCDISFGFYTLSGSEAKPVKVSRARKRTSTKEDPLEAKEFGIN